MKTETRTILLYEAPHHLLQTLRELYEALGDREISICRELTKKHETNFCTTIKNAILHYEQEAPRGECVMVIAGKAVEELEAQQRESWNKMSIPQHVEYYMEHGMDKKEAMKAVAKDRGISRRDVYSELL